MTEIEGELGDCSFLVSAHMPCRMSSADSRRLAVLIRVGRIKVDRGMPYVRRVRVKLFPSYPYAFMSDAGHDLMKTPSKG